MQKAPGLGWSRDSHPGALLFPILARLLANNRPVRITDELFVPLEDSDAEDLAGASGETDAAEASEDRAGVAPVPVVPSIAGLLAPIFDSAPPSAAMRKRLYEILFDVAEKRTGEVLRVKGRRAYGHAARLLVSCLELALLDGRGDEARLRIQKIRKDFARFSAFRGELDNALRSAGVRQGD